MSFTAQASAEKFKAINPAALAKFLAAESAMGEVVKATAAAIFDAADTNNEGILKEQGYLYYSEKMLRSYKIAYGDSIAFDADSEKEAFIVLN